MGAAHYREEGSITSPRALSTYQDPVLDQEYMVSVPEAPRPVNLFTCISEEIGDAKQHSS